MASKRGKGAVTKAQADEAAAKAPADADEERREQERAEVAALRAPHVELYVENLMRQFAETKNPMFAVEALVVAADHPAAAPARAWLRDRLVKILGLAFGGPDQKSGTVEDAVGISKETHIEPYFLQWRNAAIRRRMNGRDQRKRRETRIMIEEEVAETFGIEPTTARKIAGTKVEK
jgi:hypothetical protein